jgi:hypothetical protein
MPERGVRLSRLDRHLSGLERRARDLGLETGPMEFVKRKPPCKPFVDRYMIRAGHHLHQALCHGCGWQGTDKVDAETAERERAEHERAAAS